MSNQAVFFFSVLGFLFVFVVHSELLGFQDSFKLILNECSVTQIYV